MGYLIHVKRTTGKKTMFRNFVSEKLGYKINLAQNGGR